VSDGSLLHLPALKDGHYWVTMDGVRIVARVADMGESYKVGVIGSSLVRFVPKTYIEPTEFTIDLREAQGIEVDYNAIDIIVALRDDYETIKGMADDLRAAGTFHFPASDKKVFKVVIDSSDETRRLHRALIDYLEYEAREVEKSLLNFGVKIPRL